MASALYNPRRRRQPESAWPDIPPELLEKVIRLLDPLGRAAVRLVCTSWRSCARNADPIPFPGGHPFLLFGRPGPGGGGARDFFSIQRREFLRFPLLGGRCCGQIGGSLAMALDKQRRIALCNIFSGELVALPQPPVFPVAKVVLSAPPTSPGWVAATVGRSGCMLALIQPDTVSGSSWTTIVAGAEHGGFQDVAFWRGRLCALGFDGVVLAYRADLRDHVVPVSELRRKESEQLHPSRWRRRMYLVESDGELMVVLRVLGGLGGAVEVLRFLPEQRKWEVVTELPGNRALFVGMVASAAVPGTSGFRENCAYFAQRCVESMAPHAIAVYWLGYRKTSSVAIAGGHSADVEPVWITP